MYNVRTILVGADSQIISAIFLLGGATGYFKAARASEVPKNITLGTLVVILFLAFFIIHTD